MKARAFGFWAVCCLLAWSGSRICAAADEIPAQVPPVTESKASKGDPGLEVFGLELSPLHFSPAGQQAEVTGFTGLVRIYTLSWEHVYYVPFELGLGFFSEPRSSVEHWFFFIGNEVGYPFRFGDGLRHQLGLGLSAGLGNIGAAHGSDSYFGFVLSPTVRYQFLLWDRFPVGLSFRALLPTGTTDEEGKYRPHFLAAIDLGLVIHRFGEDLEGESLDHRTVTESNGSKGDPGLEVFGLELSPLHFSPAGQQAEVTGFTGLARVFTLSWEHFYCVPLEFGGGFYGEQRSAAAGFYFIGNEVGYPFRFGEGLRHQLRLGLGVGFGLIGTVHGTDDYDGLVLSPTVRYQFLLWDRFPIGLSLRALLPTGTTDEEGKYRPQFLAAIDLGLVIHRFGEGVEGESVDYRTKTEYFRVSLLFAPYAYLRWTGTWDGDKAAHTAGLGSGITVMGPTFRWNNFYLGVAEFTFLYGGFSSVGGSPLVSMLGGSRLGYPLFLDTEGRHEIDFSLGINFGFIYFIEMGDYSKSGGSLGLVVSPSIAYSYSANSGLTIGAGVRALIPTWVDYADAHVFPLMVTLDLGFR